ncbi:MAG: hypothetical protein AAF585_09510 [Verrucomicrobiota bacterium]
MNDEFLQALEWIHDEQEQDREFEGVLYWIGEEIRIQRDESAIQYLTHQKEQLEYAHYFYSVAVDTNGDIFRWLHELRDNLNVFETIGATGFLKVWDILQPIYEQFEAGDDQIETEKKEEIDAACDFAEDRKKFFELLVSRAEYVVTLKEFENKS